MDLILAENPLDGSALLIALSKSLEGAASNWLSQVCFSGITWDAFKELFLQQFEGNETTAATVFNALNGCPKNGECLSLYGSRLLTTLMAKWKSMTMEEIAVSVVLAHVAHIDTRLQRTVYTTNIKTRNELQNELRAFAFAKKKGHPFENNSAGKRQRTHATIKCHFCGRMGHKLVDCCLRSDAAKPKQGSNPNSRRSSD